MKQNFLVEIIIHHSDIFRDENIFNFSTLPTFQLKNTKIPQKIIAKTPEEIFNITNKV